MTKVVEVTKVGSTDASSSGNNEEHTNDVLVDMRSLFQVGNNAGS